MRNQRVKAYQILFWLLAMSSAVCARGQQKCSLPPVISAPAGSNMFTPEQEMELGDLMGEQTATRYQIIQNDALIAYMDRIASRLIAQLPPIGFPIRIFLIDDPIVDAFSTTGGRIYVSRKMVAFLRNDDELAGLLGHEIGHIVTHQSAIETTLLFQSILGISRVTSRQDLASRYNQLLDNGSRGIQTYRKIARQEEPDQYVADQVALYAVANAGYAPKSVVGFFDRLAETHGKTGNFFSNWFGSTSANEKRLGEMQKALASMPPTCSGISQVSLTGEFREWKADVVGYSRGNQREELPGLVTRQRLKPPLRGDFTNARFSPDGQYAVAQDESSIFVLTRRPFAFLFRIDAPGAQPAAFTPDSKEIVFSTQELRVEDWNVAARKRVSVHELVVQDGCVQSLLSPDGNTLACLIERGQNTSESSVSLPYLDLEIFDVSSGDSIFAKKEFLSATFENAFYLIMRRILDLDKTVLEPMAFSPDSRYLVAASRSTTLAVDLTTKAPIPLPGSLKDMLKGGFAFPAADRVIAENPDNPRKSAILNFPSGHTISQISLGTQDLDVSAQGDYILLRPVSNALVGVMEVKTGKGIMALKQSRAIDIYDQQFIAQGTSGEFGLFDIQGTNYTKAQLPESPLGPLQTHAISPDLRWLAASGKTRGAVWDLSMMKQVYSTRNFSGAFFDGNSALFADFPKNEKTGRAIIRADLAASDAKPVFPLETELNTRQFGPYLVTRNPNRKDKSTYWDVTLKIGDVRDGKPLWELNFPKEVPAISFFSREDRVVLKWDLQNFSGRESAKQVFSRYNELEKRFSVLKENRGIYLLEVLEAGTGHSIGAVLVDTGRDSFKIEDSFAAGDWLLLTDSENRIFVYSVASGELQGTIFGTYPIVSSAAGLMETRNERGQLQFYTLPALTKVGQISFSSPISMNSFDASGTRLFVLTADQTSYIFDTSALKQPSQATPVAPK